MVSGDNPWDVITIGDTYANGRLYGNTGGFFQPATDFWFQEGIDAVPEPATFALFGLGLLAFAYKRRSNLLTLVFASLLLSIPMLSARASDSVTKATADAAGLTAVSPSDLPSTGGTYWITMLNGNGGLAALPWPFLPTNLDDPTIFSITNQIFLVDTTGGKLTTSDSTMSASDATSTAQAQAQSMASLIENIENPPIPPGGGTNGEGGTVGTPHRQGIQIDPDGLYIAATNEVPDGLGGLGFLIFNPNNSFNYQLLSTTNLLATTWCLGQVLYNPHGSPVNNFTPVPMTNAMTFFRVHQAYPVMNLQNYQNAEELNPTNTGNTGQQGYFYLQNYGSQTNDVPVYYTVSGTAINGVTYSNLDGEVTVSNSLGYAYIYVNPLTNGIQPNLSLILKLTQNTNYLIDPDYAAATNTIIANPQTYPTVSGDNVQVCPDSTNYITLSGQDPNNLPLTYIITSWPTHATLDTNYGMPTVIYCPTNCYEGNDRFTFVASDGTYISTPATVNLSISDPVNANQPNIQTCRGTPTQPFSLGYDNCGETLTYDLLSAPVYGILSGTAQNLVYTPTGTNYTGKDTFSFVISSACGGDSATNYATIAIGDEDAQANGMTLITGTNEPVGITLTTSDGGDTCKTDTNYFTFSTFNGPANGHLTGSGDAYLYTPAHDFEGVDSFQYNFDDGYWTNQPATVTIDVVEGPIAIHDCNPFGTGILIDWELDTNCQAMNLSIPDYIVYESSSATGPWTPVFTNSAGTDSYTESNAVVGVTNYFTVTFQAHNSFGNLIESPKSDVVQAVSQVNVPLIPYNAVWQVVTNLATPNNITNLEAPMSNYFLDDTNQPYPGMAQLPNSNWAVGTTMSNSINMVIPTNSVPLDQVTYSIAIDNDYQIYLNDSNAPIQSFNHEGYAIWVPYQSFESVAPGLLHYGTNSLRVVITDEGGINYFSMIVSTNTCGM